jgi:cyclin-dependent kinase-like
MPSRTLSNFQMIDFLKKCLDKDPAKRWTCERLLTHSFFSDYAAQEKEMEMTTTISLSASATMQMAYEQNNNSNASNNNNNNNSSYHPKPQLLLKDKNKFSNTSLPQLPGQVEIRMPLKNTYLRSDHHLPTI